MRKNYKNMNLISIDYRMLLFVTIHFFNELLGTLGNQLRNCFKINGVAEWR